MKKKK
jgi:hypothetical protein